MRPSIDVVRQKGSCVVTFKVRNRIPGEPLVARVACYGQMKLDAKSGEVQDKTLPS